MRIICNQAQVKVISNQAEDIDSIKQQSGMQLKHISVFNMGKISWTPNDFNFPSSVYLMVCYNLNDCVGMKSLQTPV